MKVYRYKNYDFENNVLPLGFDWKEPEVYAVDAPDSDYEICNDEFCELKFLKEMYTERITDGQELNLERTAKGYIMLVGGTITSTQLQTFGTGTDGLTLALSKGYFHSAYNILDAYTPEAILLDYYTDLKATIKDYVNANYEDYFKIV